MQKPNPNDPSLIDVFDDATGAYLTTIPREGDKLQQLVQGPPATQAAPQFNMEQDAAAGPLGVLSVGSADSAPAPSGDAGKVQGIVQGTGDAQGPLAPVPQADVDTLVQSMQGSADASAAQPTLGGSPGGFQATERQTSGLSEEALGARRQDIEGIAQLDQNALLDEEVAMRRQMEEEEARSVEMEREVREARAKQAIEQKQVFDRRQMVEQKIAATSAQEPDRHRAFPKGWRLVSTIMGSIAGGMLAGLTDGRYQNQTLSALDRVLEADVREQRETQSVMLKELTRQLGSLDAAEDMLRAKQKEIVVKELDARLLGSKVKVDRVKLDAFRSRMQADIARHRVDALTKLERDETIKEVNTPGSAGVPFNAENYRARSLQQYAAENGLPVKDAHKQWVAYNKTFQERATLRSGLDTAERLVQQYEQSGDVAGLGPLAKFIPSSVNTQDAKAVRQVLGAVTAQYLKAISGAAVTEQEYARTIENLQGSGDFDSVKRGLGILKQSITSADEESQVENPGFSRLREELRTLNAREKKDPNAGWQTRKGETFVAIPRTSRIAFEHNNPGNLTFANQPGATRGEPKKGGGYWAKFESPEDGMRHLVRQLQMDQEKGFNLRQLVEKYAPKTDGNNVEAYLTFLNRETGADEATPLAEMSMAALAWAIARKESSTVRAK